MIIKSLGAASPSQQRRWKLLRRLISRRLRWFYEGCPAVPGQMWYADRKALYETIRRYKPRVVCESGTWLGGGSTYFIAQALHDNGGVLQTTEENPEFFAAATQSYNLHLRRLRPFVKFHLGASAAVYPSLLERLRSVDAVLLDGAEDSRETLGELQMFEPFLAPDALVMAHDWNTEKTALLRPYLEALPAWTLVRLVTPPHSVGFAVFQHAGAGRRG